MYFGENEGVITLRIIAEIIQHNSAIILREIVK